MTSPQQDLAQTIDALPPLPAVALRVIQVAQDPRSSASDLAQVVSADPGLSARLLKISNSAAYRRSREVTSIQEALVVLGFVQARNVAVSTSITASFPPDSLNALFRVDVFWRHSLAVAFQASELATRSRGVDPPSAFTAGILHDMGRLAMFYAQPAGLDQAVAQVVAGMGTPEEVEAKELDYDHATLGGKLARRWGLPDEIREAIAQHHTIEGDGESLAGVVAAADRTCIAAGFLPGYTIPGPEGTRIEPQESMARIVTQVDALMELIGSTSPGVRVAA